MPRLIYTYTRKSDGKKYWVSYSHECINKSDSFMSMANNDLWEVTDITKDYGSIPEIADFANQMQIEMIANQDKGDWREFKNLDQILWEFEYHKGKLLIAIKDNDKPLVKEYIADCANILMFMGVVGDVYN